jgi:hypothetical protein
MLERFPRDLLLERIHSFREMFRRNVSIESERNFSLSQSNWYFKDSWQLNCLFVVSVQKNEFNSSSMNGAIVLLEDVDRSRRSSFSSLDRSFGKSSVCRTADLQVLTLHNAERTRQSVVFAHFSIRPTFVSDRRRFSTLDE